VLALAAICVCIAACSGCDVAAWVLLCICCCWWGCGIRAVCCYCALRRVLPTICCQGWPNSCLEQPRPRPELILQCLPVQAQLNTAQLVLQTEQ
jgi:hypothetical protein